jgi:hypothetical protein
MNFLRIVSVGILTAAFLSSGEELTIEKNLSGYASLEEGQIVQGSYPKDASVRSDHVWVQRMYTGFVGSALFNPLNFKGNIGLEMRVSNEFPRKPQLDNGVTRRLYFYPYLTEADLMYWVGDMAKPFFSATIGYFPIKYNQNSRDLGEYLFRSGTYPQTLVSDFDFAATRLMGLNAMISPVEGLKLNFILNSNLEWTAIGDLNVSLLANYNLADIFEIGAGASFTSLISADSKVTDGDVSLAQDNQKYLAAPGDTQMYTFRGIKMMGMASFDPKKFIPIDIFGKEDLKLYGEVAILGLKDYPAAFNGVDYYGEISKRMPISFGFNIPAFKALDVFSFEGEYFGSLMPNDLYNGVFYNVPVPINVEKISTYKGDTANGGHKQYVQDNWKWSFYAKRTFAGHFQIVGTIASDHLRWYAQDWSKAEWEEMFRNPRQFYYRFKLAYMF